MKIFCSSVALNFRLTWQTLLQFAGLLPRSAEVEGAGGLGLAAAEVLAAADPFVTELEAGFDGADGGGGWWDEARG